MSEQPDPYILRLEVEKKAFEAQVADLQREIRTINKLIYRRKSQAIAEERGEGINLKNVDRLFFETLILDVVRASKQGLRTGEIYDRIRKSGYGLNYNTLRSYITKMRDKNLIKKRSPHDYHWVAVE